MMRKKFESGFKARVALEAFKGEKTLAQLSSEYGVHATRISKWKTELIKGAAGLFGKKNGQQNNNADEEKIEKLYRIIGELKVENDWLKKKLQLLG
jgi:transposase-like protein